MTEAILLQGAPAFKPFALVQDHFLRLFIVSPTKKCRLPQLVIGSEFRVFHLTDQLRSHPLDLFLDVGRIDERAFVGEKRFHSVDRIF